MRSQHIIDILRIKETGGFSLNGRFASNEPTHLELEWYKLGALKHDCVTVTDLYIKINSKIAIGREPIPINVSQQHFTLMNLISDS